MSDPFGPYVLPSRAVVSKRMRWRDFSADVSIAEVGYVLARQVERVVDGDCAQLRVAYWDEVPEELAQQVQLCLGSTRKPARLEPASLRFERGDYSPLQMGERVAILTDSLLTGGTAEEIVRSVRRMEAQPSVIAAVIDGRGRLGVDVMTFSDSIPVASCLSRRMVQIRDAVGEGIPSIAPSGAVETGAVTTTTSSAAIDDGEFVQWVSGTSPTSLLVGHVDRGPLRHFSTYLDVPNFIAGNRESLVLKYRGLLHDALTPLLAASGSSRIKVFAPGTGGSAARSVSAVALEALAVEFPTAAIESFDIWKEQGKWTTNSPALDPGFVGLVIDWGAVTSTTIRQMVTTVASLGARFVGGYVFTSQMDDGTRQRTEAISEIRIPRTDPSELSFPVGELFTPEQGEFTSVVNLAGPADSLVPVSFRFLADARMGVAPSSECHLCRVAQHLRQNVNAAPTDLLRHHAQEKLELFRPTTRDELLEIPATDLAGSPINGNEASKIWQLRQTLERCIESTRARQNVADRLSLPIVDALEDWTALVRLLTAEAYWLKRPPLNDSILRNRVANMCLTVLSEEDHNNELQFTDDFKWQAVMVLRCASKQSFVNSFAEQVVAATSAGQRLMAAEFCYGMHTLLESQQHWTARALSPILQALKTASHELESPPATDDLSVSVFKTVRALYSTAVALNLRFGRPQSPEQAWHELTSGYMHAVRTHSGRLTDMRRVVIALSGPAAKRAASSGGERDSAYWKSRGAAWDNCREFLSALVFPYLPLIQAQTSAIVPHGVVGSGFGQLGELTPERANRFAEEFTSLEHEPERFDEKTRLRLELEALTWFGALLQSPGSRNSGALLYRLLEGNPADILTSFRTAERRVRESLAERPVGRFIASVETLNTGKYTVFCNGPLFVDLLVQILENALKHETEAGGNAVRFQTAIEETDSFFNLTIKNDNSVSSRDAGYGLSKAQEVLETFGARLTHRSVTEGAWTYEVLLTMPKWIPEGVP